MSVEEREVFAKKLKTTVGYVKLLAYGIRGISVKFAILIDRATGGEIDMVDLLEDLDLDWDYIQTRLHQHVTGERPIPALAKASKRNLRKHAQQRVAAGH